MKASRLALTLLVIFIVAAAGCTEDGPPEEDESPQDEVMESAPGDFARAFLSDENFTKVIVEVDYVPGSGPDNGALDLLVQRIKQYCDKSAVVMGERDELPAGQGSYSGEDLNALELEYRDGYYDRDNKTITLYILYLDGEFEDSSTLGATYHASSMAIFADRIEAMSIPLWAQALGLQHSDIEASVLVHEFGHVLRLVNIGYESERDYEDPEHPHHSIHQDCVMYHAVESSAVINMLNTGNPKPPDDFHADAKADIQDIKNGKY